MDEREFQLKKTCLKIGVGLIGVVATVIIGKKIYNAIKERREANERENAASDAINTITDDFTKRGEPSPITITETEGKAIANDFISASNYTWGTDLDVIDKCLARIKNEYDWHVVRKAFGKHKYTGFIIDDRPNVFLDTRKTVTLIELCREELSGSRLAKCEAWEAAADNANLKGLGRIYRK
ncbi:MAG: hypothetical protein J6Y72_01405 [Bacteroidales bacterium]|nr:hypothetical protein [Bacteroidales bacterium]